MKNRIKITFALCLALMFVLTAGCSSQTETPNKIEPSAVTTDPAETTQTPEETDPAEATQAPEETDPVETTEATVPRETQTQTAPAPEATAPAEGYIIKIPLADQSIFSEPSYDSTFVGVVGKATNYTIVEEATDDEGNTWGKLKSGIGWVDLNEIRSGTREKLPVTVNFADEALMADKNTIRFVQGGVDYAIPVAIRPRQKLLSFSIAHYTLTGEDYEIGENLFYTDSLTAETPLVADLIFSGDFTMFVITFMDEEGAVYNYAIGESGRNGTIYMTEIEVQ